MLSKILQFVKDSLGWSKAHIDIIILVVIIMLFILFSFASGYIIAKYQDRPPIQIENRN